MMYEVLQPSGAAMRCTAKAKSTGQRCKFPAVPGKDKCRYHGGLTPIKHGLYSKYSRTKLGTLIAELRDNPDLTNVKEQVAFMFALLLQKLEVMQDRFSNEDIQQLSMLSEKITKAIETWYKVTYGEKYILQVEQVQVLINQVVHIIREEIADEAKVERIAKRLQNLPVGGRQGGL